MCRCSSTGSVAACTNRRHQSRIPANLAPSHSTAHCAHPSGLLNHTRPHFQTLATGAHSRTARAPGHAHAGKHVHKHARPQNHMLSHMHGSDYTHLIAFEQSGLTLCERETETDPFARIAPTRRIRGHFAKSLGRHEARPTLSDYDKREG